MFEIFGIVPGASFVSILVSVFAVYVAYRSYKHSIATEEKQRNIQTQDLLLRFDENVMAWGAECISEFAKLETLFSIEQPENFETLMKASLLRISALVDQGRLYIPNVDIGDGHNADKHPAYQGRRERILDLLVEIYDWGFTYDFATDEDYQGARYIFHTRREFVAELVFILNTKTRKQTLEAIAHPGR